MKKKPPEIGVELDDAAVRALYIERFGPSCAAWLVNRFRRRVLRTGAFYLYLPDDEPMPPWCDLALAFLGKRRGWHVERFDVGDGRKRFRISREKRGRALPVAIRSLN